jgi:6-phosphogluconolactonase
MNELSLAVAVYGYDGAGHTTGLIQRFAPVKKADEEAIGAHIGIHPNGRFLYASIRGLNVIVVAEIDPVTHALRFVSEHPSGGKTPRHFSIDPTGRYLLVGNQDSDLVSVFTIDAVTGSLSETGRVQVPTPVCILQQD